MRACFPLLHRRCKCENKRSERSRSAAPPASPAPGSCLPRCAGRYNRRRAGCHRLPAIFPPYDGDPPLRTLLCLSLALAAATCASAGADAPPAAAGLQPSQLAIIINDAEPNSVEVGEYYRQVHGIPAANVAHVNIPNRPRKLSMDQFSQIKERIDAQLKPGIQAVLMVWSAPYAVECNSITSAFTLGYDAGQCSRTCDAGKASPYFNSNVTQPYTQLGLRLAMLLPVDFVEEAKAVADRSEERRVGKECPV